MGLKIAFVGLEKDYGTILPEYVQTFNKYHIEIPWYYAEEGGNWVTQTTQGCSGEPVHFESGGHFQNVTEGYFKKYLKDQDTPFGYDVVVHWRKWREDMYVPGALNLLHTCDHSYPEKWKADVREAFSSGKLYGILCYRTWHQRNIQAESGLPLDRLFTDCTLGVDTDIYKPYDDKDPYQMLWSSDPGRGFDSAVGLALRLFQRDKRFKLHLCYPDYVRPPEHVKHPALVWHGSVPNGPKLWDLFNTTGVLPYTSTFMEPSSRAHRQAQAAGSLVLYPPNMGSPSELIVDGMTGVVAPTSTWVERILELVRSGQWFDMGKRARAFAETQTWKVQAQNFNALVGGILEGRK